MAESQKFHNPHLPGYGPPGDPRVSHASNLGPSLPAAAGLPTFTSPKDTHHTMPSAQYPIGSPVNAPPYPNLNYFTPPLAPTQYQSYPRPMPAPSSGNYSSGINSSSIQGPPLPPPSGCKYQNNYQHPSVDSIKSGMSIPTINGLANDDIRHVQSYGKPSNQTIMNGPIQFSQTDRPPVGHQTFNAPSSTSNLGNQSSSGPPTNIVTPPFPNQSFIRTSIGPPPFTQQLKQPSGPFISGHSPVAQMSVPSIQNPSSSEPSRDPSPIPAQNYDALEGQFSSHNVNHSHGMPPLMSQPPGIPPGLNQPVDCNQNRPSGPTGRRLYPPQGPGYLPTGPPQPPTTSNYPQNPQQQSHPKAPVVNSTPPYVYNNLTGSFDKMSLQGEDRTLNLLQSRHILPATPVEVPQPQPTHDYKQVNCSPDVFRCTLNAMPQTQQLLNKSRLPLGILIHPFKDLTNLPVIQSSVIVRCRSCRTYINPFVSFVDQRRWKCNLCYRVNDLPDEFCYDPISRSFGDPQRRPEIKSATIEFIAPSEYMLRPPQPAVYLFVLDVSFNAIETGYLTQFCNTLLDELNRLPGDARTQIGFITFDRTIHFYAMQEGISQPQMLIVSDIDDIFVPCPSNLLVNLQENKEVVQELICQLPEMFSGNKETHNALGPALQAAFKLMAPTGGRVTVMQTCLPSFGPGALKSREDPNQRASTSVDHLGPANDFYKKLSLDCSGQQIAVDLFLLSGQYSDIATLSCISKFSGGCIQFYPMYHTLRNPPQARKFEHDLRRYLTRKIGFEAVMRIRCNKGLSIHTFHGNFFVRSTDLLSLPNINPDAGFGMQMCIDESLTDSTTVCFQAALLYTSSKGERRIRVHTLCVPVTNSINEVFAGADQQAIMCLLAKMAVDRSLSASMQDARDALVNSCIDALGAYAQIMPAAQRIGSLLAPFSLRLMPLYVLATLKHIAFRVGASTRLDERIFSMNQMKTLPVSSLILSLYPNLYSVHNLDDKNALNVDDNISRPPLLHLSSEMIDRHGAYLLDAGDNIYLYIGRAISDQFCMEVFDAPNFNAIPEFLFQLPELENPTSERLRKFIAHTQSQRFLFAPLQIIKEDSKLRGHFIQYLFDDRAESTHSYYEFLQHIQQQITK